MIPSHSQRLQIDHQSSSCSSASSNRSNLHLTNLPEEIVAKIAICAGNSMSSLRLTCKLIDQTIRSATTRISLRKINRAESSNYLVALNSARFPKLSEIEISQLNLRKFDLAPINFISNCPQLKSLIILGRWEDVKSNGLNDTFVQALLQCNQLQKIHLNLCAQISNTAWQNFFKSMNQLVELRLEFANLIDTSSLCSVHLNNLKSLTLNQCQLSDQFLEQILCAASNLENLEIGHIGIKGTAFFQCASNQMRIIELSSIQFSEEDIADSDEINLAELRKLDARAFSWLLNKNPNLEKVTLNCNSDDELFFTRPIPELKNFKFPNPIALSFYNLDMRQVKWLIQGCSQLNEINIDACTHFQHLHYPFINKLTAVKAINISDSDIDDRSFSALFSSCNALERINLCDCPKITRLAWTDMNFSQLRVFQLCAHNDGFGAQTQAFTSNDLAQLAKKAPLLQEISINSSDNDSLGNESDEEQFPDMSGAFEHLKSMSLSISEAKNWSNAKVLNLLKRSRDLEELSLFKFGNITDEIVDDLIESFTKMRELRIEDCSKISKDKVKLIRNQFGNKQRKIYRRKID